MQIVTDRGVDLAPKQMAGLKLNFVPLRIELEGKTYLSGVDIMPQEFYSRLEETGAYPLTSQPSPADFATLYRELAKTDPEILSIHMSSGLSGTMHSALQAAEMVPEAKITYWDTMTLSVPAGWQVEAAARTLQAGWPVKDVLAYLEEIRAKIEGIYTLAELKYLVHGGRISHLKGMMAAVLNIKPIIMINKANGKYADVGKERTLKRAIRTMANMIAKQFNPFGKARIQLLHGYNLEGLEMLKAAVSEQMDCVFDPTTEIAPVLGAHTGPSMVGLSAGPLSLFEPLYSELSGNLPLGITKTDVLTV